MTLASPESTESRLLAGERAACALGAEAGFFLLDTCDPRHGVPMVLAGANPTLEVRGAFPDLAPLLSAADALPEDADPARDGAWVGSIDYAGRYRFSLYPRPLREPEAGPTPWNGVASLGKLTPAGTRDAYEAIVRRAQEYIAAGDIYQVNLAQRFHAEFSGDSLALHLAARRVALPQFGAYFHHDGTAVSCASPELFLRIAGRHILTRPIKGTRPRMRGEADVRLARELRESAKERAEIIMITDLERNDLGRVCEYGTIRVPRLAEVEHHPQVHHLVSEITGLLRPDVHLPEALRACFPGGSITGAPKRRAMEIISELEPFPRGMFCGAMGWFAGGNAVFNIAIRMAEIQGDSFTAYAGAGIVADSNPAAEYDETLLKTAHWAEAAQWLRERS